MHNAGSCCTEHQGDADIIHGRSSLALNPTLARQALNHDRVVLLFAFCCFLRGSHINPLIRIDDGEQSRGESFLS